MLRQSGALSTDPALHILYIIPALPLHPMHFSQIINAAISKENDRPLMQKEVYPVSAALQQYLQQYHRDIELPIAYKELLHYQYSNAIKDEKGKHTHWERVLYEKKLLVQLQQKLMDAYQLLQKENNTASNHLTIQHIDFCEFANSMPFRITISNTQNNSQDFFYIKSADASRIYGLELEQLLSPNDTNFLYHQNTLVEEHIEGIPGDIFLETVNHLTTIEKKLLAEEFVRFNERCFARLLGDMRSYNFVLIKNNTAGYRIRAIDFDQQCYEGKMNLYLPQFYKENYGYVQLTENNLYNDLIEAIRLSERKDIAFFAAQSKQQLTHLLDVMYKEELSENYKISSLRKELGACFNSHHFARCKTMGAILKEQLNRIGTQ